MDCIRPNEYKTLDRGLPTGDLLSPDALYWDFDPVKGGFKIFRANKEGTQAFPLIAGIESIEKLSAGDGLLGNDFDGVLPVEWSVDFGYGSNQVARGNHTHSFSEITGTLGLSQIQNINSNTLLGRYGAGSGAPQSINLGTGFSVSGGTLVFNESDPTVPSYVKSITETQISNWDSAYANSHPALSITGQNYITLDVGDQELTVGAINLNSSHTSGLLPVTKGGTGLTSIGTAGQFLRVNGAGNALEYYSLPSPVTPDLQAVTDQGATTTNSINIYNSGGGFIQVMNPDDGSYVFNAVSPTISAIAGYHTAHSFGIGSNSSLGAAFLLFQNNTTSDEWILEYSSGLSATLGAGNQLRVQQDPVHNNDLARKLYVDTGLSAKFDIPTGTTSQYIRGDGSLATFPSIPTVGDGVLTLAVGTGLTGSATFSANQAGNSTFTVGLGTNLSNLNALSTSGFVKKTGANTWGIDTTTYMAASNAYTKVESDARYLPVTNKYVSVFNNPATTDSIASLDFDDAPMSTILRAEPAVNSPEGSGLIYTFGDAGSRAYQLFQGHGFNDSFWYRTRLTSAGGWRGWLQVAARSWVDTNYYTKTASDAKYALLSNSVSAGNGLTGGGAISSNPSITLGTPGNITLASTNSVTSDSHTHAFVPGGSTSQYIRGDGSLATFPIIGDGTLTLAAGTGLTGSASFTANQSGNSTFTVGLGTNLSNLNALSTSGFVKKTGSNTWTIDTSTYLTGTGTSGYIPKWGTSSSLNDSAIYQDGSGRIGIGTTSMDVRLVVDGGLAVYGNTAIRPDGVGNGIFNVWRDIVVGDTVNDVHGTVFIHDGIGTPLKNSNAAFEVKSTTKGVLFPRMTATQRDAIAGPAGMVVYNTTANAISLHNGTSWIDLASSSFPINYVTTDTSQTGLGGNKTWTGHHIIAPSTTSSPASLANSVRISRNSNGAFITIENGSAVSAVTLRSWNGGTDNKYQISLLTGGIETGNHGTSEDWYTAWQRIIPTNVGRTGNGIIANNTTLNSEQAWSDLPIGYSAFVYSNVGVANGAPANTFGYFTKVANRDVGGGWGGLWIDYNFNAFYVGKASDNTTFATWSRVLTAYTPTTLSTGQLLRWDGTGWANWTPDFVPQSRVISAGTGLTGGGALSTNISLSLSQMTSSAIGGAKLFSNTTQSVAANSVSSTAGRTYGIQLNSSGQLVVNVPWSDNNTTYTSSNGISLSGTNFSPVYGTSAGTIAQGNDSRINNGQTAYSWGNHAGLYVPIGRVVTASTGLSGGGSLATNISLSVNFGTSAGTVAQGNDSRIINGQTAYGWGNHANAGYFTSGGTVPSVGTIPMFSGTNTIGNSFLTQSGGTLYYSGNVNVSNDLTVGSLAYFNGNVNLYKSATVSENLYVNQGLYVNGSTVLMGGGGSLSCALLTLNSTTKGLVVTRMSRTQRVSIVSPQPGLIVFQTDTSGGDEQGFWGYLAGGQGWRRFNFQ